MIPLINHEQVYRDRVATQPDDANARYGLALFFAFAGKSEEAIQEYRKGIQLDSTLPYLYLGLGDELAKIGHTEEAMHVLQTGLQMAPMASNLHFSLGKLYESQSDFEKAIHHLETALALEEEAGRDFEKYK